MSQPSTRLLAGVLALSLGQGLALAQNPTLNTRPAPLPSPDTPSAINPASLPLTEPLDVEAAMAKARKTKRLLLIFWCGDTPDNPAWTFSRAANSLTLRAYIKWHCVAVQSSTLPRSLTSQINNALNAQSQTGPAVILVRDGAIEQVIGTEQPFMEHGLSAVRRRASGPVSTSRGNKAEQFIPGPVRILFQTDFAMDRIRAREPIWGELHDQANPAPPPPPEPEPFCRTPDDLFSVVWDPRPEEHIGALDRLAQARQAMKDGDFVKATSLYTWLWERSGEFDPAFRPARLSILAQDIAALLPQFEQARARFDRIRDIRTDHMPWADHSQMHEWFVLSAATAHSGDTLEYLDYVINDADEGTMLPAADAMAYKLLTRRENFAAAWQLPPAAISPVARVQAIAQRQNPKFPGSVSETARAEYRAFARQFLLDEGSRLYVSCLVKGDDPAAQEIARIILAARPAGDAATRLALITTALAADPPQARPIHLQWLNEVEASESTPKRPDLRTRLILATTPAPNP